MQVMVIGAGIGGLALACGLQRHGIDVEVVERDTDLARTGGYHLHLHAPALSALRRLLDPDVLEQLYAVSAGGRADDGVVVRDHRGRLLTRGRAAVTADQSLNVDRVTLRTLLGRSVASAVQLGRSYVGCELGSDGTVEARFSDGSRSRADVLVGADGVGSRVAEALAGRPTSAPVGLIGVGGFTPVDALSSSAAGFLGAHSTFAVGPRGTGLYIGYHDPRGEALITTPLDQPPATQTATYIWGAMIAESDRTRELLALGGADLGRATSQWMRGAGWSTRLITVIEHARTQGLAAFRLHAAIDPAQLAPWPAGRITALGDAVHAVPPTGGQGAATAILDADLLCRELCAALRGEKAVNVAVNDFHHQMRSYARVAVTESLRPVSRILATATPVGATLLRVALPVAGGLSAARYGAKDAAAKLRR